MKKLSIILLILVLISSGCERALNTRDEIDETGTTLIEEIVNNKEEYNGKNVTITGKFSKTGWGYALIGDESYINLHPNCIVTGPKEGETYTVDGYFMLKDDSSDTDRIVCHKPINP